MFSNHNKTPSFEYRRNELCHKILDALYFHAKPVIRENTFGKMMQGIEGTMISNKFFPSLDIENLPTKFNETDVFIQDCCEFLELNKHIEPTEKQNDIITKIKFTKLGVDAFKSDYYLKQNKEAVLLRQLQKSTTANNILTPFIATIALVFAILGYYKSNNVTVQLKLSPQDISSSKQTQVLKNSANQSSTKNNINGSYKKPSKLNDTTR